MQNPNPKDDDDLLTFSLSCNRPKRETHSFPTNPPPLTMQTPFINPMLVPFTASNHNNMDAVDHVHVNAPVPSSSRSRRRARFQGRRETIPPPFPWATNHRATVHTRKYLLENKIVKIKGSVECKRCKNKFEMVLDLEGKFSELWSFIQKKKDSMHDREPKVWMQPVLPKCQHCGQENSVQPSLAGTKKKAINWLFLLLGQMLGCCTLKQLKYFLKHTNIHRAGAKDRNLYSTYMGLCKQLVPEWFGS
ncbi:hypothetical protein AAZX31_15G098200 [Glycine max]|nr:hypothetical protein JHK86_041964 [Glycine max]KAG4956200.1 hypothetical protein JHK85_042580 [Glycine max]KAG5104938.1 hypothetical protein JHK82_041908 [Glycine max]KAH1208551.1 hypothetical protein GmHk_15G043328 [Glycine max]